MRRMEDCGVDVPVRLNLFSKPTQIRPLRTYTGPQIHIKCDDEAGSVVAGNKIRKLEFLLAEAISQNATVVITCGAIQSNHARSTAVACARLGLKCGLVLRGDPKSEKIGGNYFMDMLSGAVTKFISNEEWEERRGGIMDNWADEYWRAQQGEKPFIIPEGGSNATGCWGYASLVSELIEQNALSRLKYIVVPVGTGGTLAGILIGMKLFRVENIKLIGVAVCRDKNYFVDRVDTLCRDFSDKYKVMIQVDHDKDYRLVCDYVGPGYALPYEEELMCIRDAARDDGLFLDPVYTGKAFYAMLQMIKKGEFRQSDRLLFIHTGGVFGLLTDRSINDMLAVICPE